MAEKKTDTKKSQKALDEIYGILKRDFEKRDKAGDYGQKQKLTQLTGAKKGRLVDIENKSVVSRTKGDRYYEDDSDPAFATAFSLAEGEKRKNKKDRMLKPKTSPAKGTPKSKKKK